MRDLKESEDSLRPIDMDDLLKVRFSFGSYLNFIKHDLVRGGPR